MQKSEEFSQPLQQEQQGQVLPHKATEPDPRVQEMLNLIEQLPQGTQFISSLSASPSYLHIIMF